VLLVDEVMDASPAIATADEPLTVLRAERTFGCSGSIR